MLRGRLLVLDAQHVSQRFVGILLMLSPMVGSVPVGWYGMRVWVPTSQILCVYMFVGGLSAFLVTIIAADIFMAW